MVPSSYAYKKILLHDSRAAVFVFLNEPSEGEMKKGMGEVGGGNSKKWFCKKARRHSNLYYLKNEA